MKNREMWLYLLIIAILFYVFPLVIDNFIVAILLLLVFFPVACFLCSFLYGLKYSFTIVFPISISILFLPTVYIYYNNSALVYTLIYGIISLLAMIIGKGVSNYDRKRKND